MFALMLFFLFVVASVSEKDEVRSMSDAGELDRGSYDKATQDVLDVEFPTWYYSTHGLSRPSTPVEEDKQRSVPNRHMHIFRKGLIPRNT